MNDLAGWLGYELTILFSLIAIFGFQFATYVKIRKIEKIIDEAVESESIEEEDEEPE